MEAFGTLVSNVQVVVGQVSGVTCLPLPPDPRVYVDGNYETAVSTQQSVISTKGNIVEILVFDRCQRCFNRRDRSQEVGLLRIELRVCSITILLPTWPPPLLYIPSQLCISFGKGQLLSVPNVAGQAYPHSFGDSNHDLTL